jgi:hypothetical protein
MKLNKRDDIKVTLWEDDKIIANESNTVYAEINDDDLYLLIKTDSKDFKIKVAKNAIFEEIKNEQTT